MQHRIFQIKIFLFLAIIGLNAQTDTIKSMEWDESTIINPYEEPNDIVFDYTKVQERYREVLNEMNNLSTDYATKIKITGNKIETNPNDKSIRLYLRNLKKRNKTLQRDIESYLKVYSSNGISVKLHKANKKYSKKYMNKKLVEEVSTQENNKKRKLPTVHYDFDQYEDKVFASYDSYPAFECDILFDGVDNTTLEKRKQLTSHPFFYYTHPNLKSYYKDQSFLTGAVSAMKLGKHTFITFKIVIKSKDAMRNYGTIEQNSQMRIKTISGEYIYLPAIKTSHASINKKTGYTEYYIAFNVDKSNRKELKKNDIDKIGMMWSSGFEEYDVFYVDLLKEQLNCLQKK